MTLFFVRLWVQCANPSPNHNLFVRLWVQYAKLSPNHNLIVVRLWVQCANPALLTTRRPAPWLQYFGFWAENSRALSNWGFASYYRFSS